MIVQTYFPQKLSPSRYDAYLASGWFRGSVMLYKMDLLCLEKDIYSVVNIRLNLEQYEIKKRHRRLLQKNDERFTTVIREATITSEKERLYSNQKKKFKGFIHHSLNEYLNSGHRSTVFNTLELCVYHHERLVAVSFFDLGGKSVASLLALYDPEYASHSLGIYTMLKETNFALERGVKWYYPGYILDKPSSFNYKLSLGDVEYYNNRQRWSRFEKFDPAETGATKYKSHQHKLKKALRKQAIESKHWLYPFFSMGYMESWHTRFIKYPSFFEIPFGTGHFPRLIVSYDVDKGNYAVLLTKEGGSHSHMIQMEVSEEFKTDPIYYMKLLEKEEVIFRSKDPEEVARLVQTITSSIHQALQTSSIPTGQ